jgi:cell division protein FtsQ
MWNDHRQLNRLSAWLLLLAGLAVGMVAVRALTEGLFPIREVTVLGARQAETQRELRRVIPGLEGGFFSLDLDAARRDFERLPWVRQATVRRLWPNRLLVEIEEHVPLAAWNGQQTLSVRGELFPVRPWDGLPRVHAPDGMQRQVAMRLAEFQGLVAPAGWRIASLQVSPRGAWRLALEAATPARSQALAAVGPTPRVSLELGRDRHLERMKRFLVFYDAAAARLGPLTQIDLRYPNGFAVKRPGAADRGEKKPLSALACTPSPDPCHPISVT